MEQGIYGPPPGKNITVDYQEFNEAGTWTWYKPTNAKLCFIRGSGGGEGGNGTAGGGAAGGAAGCAHQFWMAANRLLTQETVVVGPGGAGGTSLATAGGDGGNTTFAGFTWAGGAGNSASRNSWVGSQYNPTWGSGGAGNGDGRVGGWGAGGGGGGGGASATGKVGGQPRLMQYDTNLTTVAVGGGAAGGTSVTLVGANADPAKDVDGYGEGGGGGYGGVGGNGGNGRRGSGGGGAGNGSSGNGGNGGDGFLNIITYCWE